MKIVCQIQAWLVLISIQLNVLEEFGKVRFHCKFAIIDMLRTTWLGMENVTLRSCLLNSPHLLKFPYILSYYSFHFFLKKKHIKSFFYFFYIASFTILIKKITKKQIFLLSNTIFLFFNINHLLLLF
jgi:hypothetical protein